jgi:hypothetical protein
MLEKYRGFRQNVILALDNLVPSVIFMVLAPLTVLALSQNGCLNNHINLDTKKY